MILKQINRKIYIGLNYHELDAISGSWRTMDATVEADVRACVAEIIARGDGIVTGGALGVDYIAVAAALDLDPQAQKNRIITPAPMDIFCAHYRRRAGEGVITHAQAEMIIAQLERVRALNQFSIIEMPATACNQETYYARNTAIIEMADGLYAFQVNASGGTGDAVDKARSRGIPVTVKAYTIE